VNARTSSAALMLASMPHLGRETIRGEVTPSPSERRPWSSPGVPLFFPTERAKTGPPEHAALLGYDASASKGQRDLASMILSLASESQRVESSAHPDLSIRLVSGQLQDKLRGPRHRALRGPRQLHLVVRRRCAACHWSVLCDGRVYVCLRLTTTSFHLFVNKPRAGQPAHSMTRRSGVSQTGTRSSVPSST